MGRQILVKDRGIPSEPWGIKQLPFGYRKPIGLPVIMYSFLKSNAAERDILSISGGFPVDQAGFCMHGAEVQRRFLNVGYQQMNCGESHNLAVDMDGGQGGRHHA